MGQSIGFGLDLAGLSNHNSTVLAAIEAENSTARLTILTNSPFNRQVTEGMNFPKRLEAESLALSALLNLGAVAVDVPIDLQGLPEVEPILPWELTRRPIDKALGGLPPLASLLGACVARFRAILEPNLKDQLGRRLFEMYPAASLMLCDLPCRGYKRGEESSAVRLNIARSLSISLPIEGNPLNHDELDASICAIAAVAGCRFVLEGDNLQAEMLKKLGSDADARRMKPPVGYRLLSKPCAFEHIGVFRQGYDDWMAEHLQPSTPSSSPA